MKITASYLTTVGATAVRKTVVLGDDAAGELISGYLPSVDALIQEVPRPRAAAVEFYDRKNERTEMVFQVSRKHASRDAALTFLLTHPYEVPRKADIQIEHGAVRKKLLSATIRPIRCVEQVGIRTVLQYTIHGGLTT